MNTQTHRLVFNRSRGGLMAVGEHARSCGGRARSSRTRRGHVALGFDPATTHKLNELQGGLQDGLQKAGMSAEASKAIASLTTGAAAAAMGAAAGGTAGAAAAFNADMNNRQLHPGERQLAVELAKKSGGKYSAKQIEDALRNAGNSALGESVVQGMVVDANNPSGVYDTGAIFTAGAQGSNSIVQQLPNSGRVDPELAAFIKANTGSGTPYGWSDGQLGKAQPSPANPNANANASLNTITPATNGCVTAECAAGVRPVGSAFRDGDDIREDVANAASMVSRGAGIVSAGATAATVVPGPHQTVSGPAAIAATGVGLAADAVEQLARPDVGKGVNDFFTTYIQYRLDQRLPLVAPITNEAVQFWKNSGTRQSFSDWINAEFNKALSINKEGGENGAHR